MYTHFFSFQPSYIKRGVLVSLFLRAFRICDPEFLSEEIDFLKSTFSKLGYPIYFIDSALSFARRRFHNPLAHNPRPPLTLSLPYVPSLVPLKRHCLSKGISLVFTSSNSLKNTLVKTSPFYLILKSPVFIQFLVLIVIKFMLVRREDR